MLMEERTLLDEVRSTATSRMMVDPPAGDCYISGALRLVRLLDVVATRTIC